MSLGSPKYGISMKMLVRDRAYSTKTVSGVNLNIVDGSTGYDPTAGAQMIQRMWQSGGGATMVTNKKLTTNQVINDD